MMTDTVGFLTPGLMDTSSFTTFGLNAKPGTSSPIGHFGTGLKYAIAVILRHGLSLRMFIGEVEYEFYTKKTKFRGREFDSVHYRKKGGLLRSIQYHKLPFTLELGKNWELWMAFRELYSNTLDEQGDIEQFESGNISGTNGFTAIYVEGADFTELFKNRNEFFLDKPDEVIDTTSKVTIYNSPSKYMYYNGMRVATLPKPSVYTYDLGGATSWMLTEDRTLKYENWAWESIAEAIVNDITDASFIRKVIKASKGQEDNKKKLFEDYLPFDTVLDSTKGSATFQEAIKDIGRHGNLRSRLRSSYSNYYAGRSSIEDDEEIPTLTEEMQSWLNEDALDKDKTEILQAALNYIRANGDTTVTVDEWKDNDQTGIQF